MPKKAAYNEKAVKRLSAKVIINANGCWIWNARIEPNGYGRFGYQGRMCWAHRISYELFKGEIPAGLDLDHLCRNRACVNPDHLEPVTRLENASRGIAGQVNRDRMLSKTHCPQGHPYSGDNLYITPKEGYRQCRICRAGNSRKRKVEMA